MYRETLWAFSTANFRVEWQVSPCTDLDLSFDDTGETAEKIASGEWLAFDSAVRVFYRGAEVGCDYLGQSIYEDPRDFRDHIGLSEIASKAKARKNLAEAKADFAKRIAYCRGKRVAGEWSHSHYMQSTAVARDTIRTARRICEVRMSTAGKCGSYFSDMVRIAVQDARKNLADRPKLRA